MSEPAFRTSVENPRAGEAPDTLLAAGPLATLEECAREGWP